MALITSDRSAMRFLGSTWPQSTRIVCPSECELTTPGSCEGCFGTDMNRNWDINWCANATLVA